MKKSGSMLDCIARFLDMCVEFFFSFNFADSSESLLNLFSSVLEMNTL